MTGAHDPAALLARIACLTGSEADIAFLLACLGQPHTPVQRRAAEALAAIAARGGPVAPALLVLLADTGPATLRRRWGAAYALALIGPPPEAALATLLEALGTADGDVRWAAADIVTRMGARALPALIRLVATGTSAQRKMALYCLRDLGATGDDAEAAARAATNDDDAAVRLAAIAALVRLSTDRAAAAARLLHLAGDPHAGVRRAAIHALGVLGYRCGAVAQTLRAAAASSTDPALRRAAAQAMRMLGVES